MKKKKKKKKKTRKLSVNTGDRIISTDVSFLSLEKIKLVTEQPDRRRIRVQSILME